jgi:hypothetical protein
MDHKVKIKRSTKFQKPSGIKTVRGSKPPAKRKPSIGLTPVKQVSPKFMNFKQPVKVVKSGTKKKTKSRKRGRMGAMQKNETGTMFKPFMM